MSGFFRRAENGSIVFTTQSQKHKGHSIEDVARTDPNYLRWAWRDRTVGLPTEVFEKIGEVMETFGISFTRGKRKKKG